MTLSSDISTTSTALSDIKSAIIAKGVTPTGNITTYAAAIGNIQTGGYQLHRVKDDSNNEIGTAFMEFKDGNGNKYDVVCLDAQYRLATAKWTSYAGAVTNLSEYSMNGAGIDLITNTYTDTATSNCDKILSWCTANSYTSEAVSHCRSKSFVIDGTTYYGQLPNLCELFYICANRAEISNADTSKSSYSSLDIATLASRTWSSSQCNSTSAWYVSNAGGVYNTTKTYSSFVAPVLEIPHH